MTLQEYINSDEDLATNQILEKDWEINLLASIREEKTTSSDEEEEGDLESTPVVGIKTATKYLYELRDFCYCT